MRSTSLMRSKSHVWVFLFFALTLWGLWLAQPVLAQSQNGITSPSAGDTLTGVVIITGTATGDSFLRYEVAFNNGGDWVVFAESDQSVINGTLAIWDTSIGSADNPVFPDGNYQLRLRVVRQDYNYDEYFATGIVVANDGAQPTATPPETDEAPAGNTNPTATPLSGTVAPVDIFRPTSIPSLTPFPTPSPQASPVNAISGLTRPDDPNNPSPTGGLLDQFRSAFNSDRFGQAFTQGITLVLFIFAALALYLIIRALTRWLWRQIRIRLRN